VGGPDTAGQDWSEPARSRASVSLIERLAMLPRDERAACLADVPIGDRWRLLNDWRFRARAPQLAPTGDWAVWLILAGRGFGKTRAGAEWVNRQALMTPGCRIALVGTTLHDAEAVMVRGESGILGTAPDRNRPLFLRSKRELHWPNGSLATLFSAGEADALRGPQFHAAWCDEIAAWSRPRAAWDNLRMCLRLGERPQAVVTTTPRPTAFLRDLTRMDGVVLTRGSTFDNRINLPASYLADMEAGYGGTALGRQELAGELLERIEGALWSRDALERCRMAPEGALQRVVVGVDPPAGPGTCGIIVAGLDARGKAYVLSDRSLPDASPDDWVQAVVSAHAQHGADCIVVEVNQGGRMVEKVLEAGGHKHLPLKPVRATVGKVARAEPVATLYARGLVAHARPFPELEDQLCGLITGGGYRGPGSSPDRADALVWALTELMLAPPAPAPTLRAI
jgi:phage terminase large subunit-like protein